MAHYEGSLDVHRPPHPVCASTVFPQLFLDLTHATGLLVSEHPFVASPPVLDVGLDRHWRVRFLAARVDQGLCRLMVQVHYDGGHGSFPKVGPHVDPSASISVHDVETGILQVKSPETGEDVPCGGRISGEIVFNTSWKAPAACPPCTKDHTPIRLKLYGVAPDASPWFVSNLSEGFLMRGRQIQHSRSRTTAKTWPAPTLTATLKASLLSSIPFEDIEHEEDAAKSVVALCTRLLMLCKGDPVKRGIARQLVQTIVDAYWPLSAPSASAEASD